jgi:hypothetical protein
VAARGTKCSLMMQEGCYVFSFHVSSCLLLYGTRNKQRVHASVSAKILRRPSGILHVCHKHFVVLSIYRSAFCAGRGNCISAIHFKDMLKTAVTTAMQDFLQVTKVGQIQNTLAIIDYVVISGSRYREIYDAHP